ncbi:MAG: ribose-5-phosphate isomerase RpiA [Planctomycetota bacterium]
MKVDIKKIAGWYAAELVQDASVIGLGTGSTVSFVLERLSQRIKQDGLRVTGIPTSKDTEAKARELGIELTSLREHPRVDITLDGADEVDGAKNLIKGGGGALLREKVLAAASKELVIVIGENKVVDRLGIGFLLPVEVLPYAVPYVQDAVKEFGCQPFLRADASGDTFITDNGNHIIDCRFDGIDDPGDMEIRINMIPGVVENGLFVGRAGRVVVGNEDGSVRLL